MTNIWIEKIAIFHKHEKIVNDMERLGSARGRLRSKVRRRLISLKS